MSEGCAVFGSLFSKQSFVKLLITQHFVQAGIEISVKNSVNCCNIHHLSIRADLVSSRSYI